MELFAVICWHVRLNQSYYKLHEIKDLAAIYSANGLTWKAKYSIL